MDWNEKYRPRTLDDVAGNEDIIRAARAWAEEDTPDEALCFYGPPGLGKTTIAHAIGNDYDFSVHEMNASDLRRADELQETFVQTAQSREPDFTPRLVIMDEVDSLDQGGTAKIREGLDEATQHVVLICNDFHGGLSKGIRDRVDAYEFEGLNVGPIAMRLKEICEEEGVHYEIKALRRLAKTCKGDLRIAVNNLRQSISQGYTLELPEDYEVPSHDVVIGGGDDVDREVVYEVADQIVEPRNPSRLDIRGSTKFERYMAEWARDNGIDYTFHLPRYEERMPWSEEELIHFQTLAETAERVVPGYLTMDDGVDSSDEYAHFLSMCATHAYGWIDPYTDGQAGAMWESDRLQGDKVNLADAAEIFEISVSPTAGD